ncbi:MAG TPA: solute carrier family 23 protein [Pseudolabrys sp.]|nr:solute carrier family 23 protein [Pseudolabrys sp.]
MSNVAAQETAPTVRSSAEGNKPKHTAPPQWAGGSWIARFLRRAYADPILAPDVKKPASLFYNADERPTAAIALSNGMQHVGLIAINLVYPLLVCRAVGVPVTVTEEMLSLGMIVLAAGTVIQVLRLGPIGSGFMLPSTFTATYFAPSLLAARLGGLPLVFGMTVFAGAFEAALAPLLNRLRTYLPVEVSGLVIFMIGVAAGLAGLRTLLGPSAAAVTSPEWIVAGITLGSMAGLNIWGKGIARMLCALIGLTVGYLVAIPAGLLTSARLAPVFSAAWLGFPGFGHISWSFDPALIAPFAIASVAAAMKAAGTITICQKMNDANWVRPDMRSVTRGVLTDGVATMLAGLAGGVGTNTSTPSAGLAAATGVASRNVAIAAAGIFFVLGFCPKLTAVLAITPRAVVVAALIFTVTFIMINGLQVMMSRMLDARRTLVLGLGILAGMTIEVFPQSVKLLPSSIAAVAGSSLVSATVVALVLNLIFRIGVRKIATLEIKRDQVNAQKVEDFFTRQSGAWGARPDVAKRAAFGVAQLVDAIADTCWESGTMTVRASFDEFNFDIDVTYPGERIDFPDERPSVEQIRDSEDGARLLAGFMLRRNADRVRSGIKDGQCTVHFHFEH